MRISKNKLSIGFFWLAGLVANASGWLFALIANKSLSLEDMGNLALLTNSITLVSIASIAIAVATNTYAAKNSTEAKAITAAFGKLAIYWGLIAAGIFLIGSPWWSSYFNFPNSWLILSLSALTIFLMFPIAWIRGFLQARLFFVLVGVGLLLEATAKVLLTWLSTDNPRAFEIIVAAILSSSIIVLLFYLYGEGNQIIRLFRNTSQLKRSHWIFLIKIMIARIGVIALLTVDIFFAKKYLPPEQAGTYALLSLVGKTIFFIMQSFYILITPLIAPSLSFENQRRKLMIAVLIGASGIIASLIGIYTALPAYSIGLMLGDRYHLIMPYALPYLVACGLLSLALLISLYKMLRGQFIFTVLVLLALGEEILLMMVFNDSIQEIANNVLVASSSLAILAFIIFCWNLLRPVIKNLKN